jgi:hypothetical protein
LTNLGERFVAGMASTMDGWWREPVPEAIGAAAHEVAEAVTVLWRIRNYAPTPADVEALAAAYLDGVPSSTVEEPTVVARPATPARQRGLAAGIRQHLLNETQAEDGPAQPFGPGDRAYLAGDLRAAADAYRGRITADPDDDDAWVGLAMTLRRDQVEPTATVLRRRPDLVRALVKPTGATPDALARWLSGAPGAGQGDAGQGDAGQGDAGQGDAGQGDAGQGDAGQGDGGSM